MKSHLKPLKLADVSVDSAFWSPRQEANRLGSIPHILKILRKTGCIDSFRADYARRGGGDTDVYKWLEAVAYSLATTSNPRLEKTCDEIIDLIAAAQQSDGYLCMYIIRNPQRKWKNLRDAHEMYCAGHLFEAAVAYYQSTGKRKLLDVACRFADHIDATFGREKGKKRGYCGHPEIELGLVKLYEATGEKRYLKLSKYMVDERGRQPHYFDAEAIARGDDPKVIWGGGGYEVFQAHIPVRRQKEAVGHAVRAVYLYSAMADLARETGDKTLLAACRTLWESITVRKMYLTGGIGATNKGEAFGKDYDLPNNTAYTETCAAIGLVMFAQRMLRIDPDSRYADVMERALYNGLISGVSADGTKFFYCNPLSADGTHTRQKWHSCPCCPPNVTRLLSSLGQYVYTASDDKLYVHLYVGGRGKALLAGQDATITQRTNYPWDGDVAITVNLAAPAAFEMMLRVPAWCRGARISVNGKRFAAPLDKGYARIRRQWSDGDRVQLAMDMPIERIAAHPAIADDAGKVALQRGPLVYCLEQCDHAAPDVRSIVLPDKASLTSRMDKSLFGGTVVIEGEALAPATAPWRDKLYAPSEQAAMKPAKIKAIPYCLWNNRELGKMSVWLARR